MNPKKRILTRPGILTIGYIMIRLLKAGGSRMTANQVAYWQLQEAKRHNVAQEVISQQQTDNQRSRWENQNIVDLRTVSTRERANQIAALQAATAQHRADTERARFYTDQLWNFLNAGGNVVKQIGDIL